MRSNPCPEQQKSREFQKLSADKQTHTQTNKETNKQTDRQKQTDKQPDRQTNEQTNKNKQTNKHMVKTQTNSHNAFLKTNPRQKSQSIHKTHEILQQILQPSKNTIHKTLKQ